VPEPSAVGVYVTEHVPELSVQVALLKVPVPSLENVTVLVGVIFVPEFVSLTVAVQVVALLSESGFGEQVTSVEVGLIGTVRVC